VNQRSFFKSLALLGAAAVGWPGVFVPKFEPVRWKARDGVRAVLNPQWLDAPNEMIFNPSAFYGSWMFIVDSNARTIARLPINLRCTSFSVWS